MCIESRVLLEYTEESNPDAAVEDSPSAQEGDEQVYDSEAIIDNETTRYAMGGGRRIVNVMCNPPYRRTHSGQCRLPV
ncbi:hypothetical protein QE152_g31003 [Popillia japonica]|uniref:Uncharacterized protein n=1 Tax=Popillia japonica TaxID=7064 RepID=A0AAW1JDB3_POPJA